MSKGMVGNSLFICAEENQPGRGHHGFRLAMGEFLLTQKLMLHMHEIELERLWRFASLIDKD